MCAAQESTGAAASRRRIISSEKEKIPESAIPGIRNGNALSSPLLPPPSPHQRVVIARNTPHKTGMIWKCIYVCWYVRMKIESYIAGAHHELMIFYLSPAPSAFFESFSGVVALLPRSQDFYTQKCCCCCSFYIC